MSAGEGWTAAFKPTPPAESALVLQAVQGDHGQWAIRNGPGSLGGEFDRYYVELSGYCGEHNPHVFAAAPELQKALEKARNTLAGLGHPKIAANICDAALNKALGK